MLCGVLLYGRNTLQLVLKVIAMNRIKKWLEISRWVMGMWFISGASVVQSAELASLLASHYQKVSDQVHAFVGELDDPNQTNQGFISNSTIVVTDTSVVVVDPGSSLAVGQALIKEIRKITDKPVSHVINTHHHADHWLGNHAFSLLNPKPSIIGHKNMAQAARDIAEQRIEFFGKLTQGANKGTQVVLPEQWIETDTTLTVGKTRIQLLHPAHAHTLGDLAVYLPDAQILITGDILFQGRTPGFQDASPAGNLATLKAFKQLAIKKIVPGHGPVSDTAALDDMIVYIETLQQQVQHFTEQGLEHYEMLDKIDMGKFKSMSGFDTRFSGNVRKVYMELEASSF